MPTTEKLHRTGSSKPDGIRLPAIDAAHEKPETKGPWQWIIKRWMPIVSSMLILLLALGVFAKNGWLPHTDRLGKKVGWFGKPFPKNTEGSAWNPFLEPPPSPTPALSKELIYAGNRLLTVEDARASAIPPIDLAVWRPSTGEWFVLGADGQTTSPITWGEDGDIPVQGDYDGDGKTDFSVFRPSNAYSYIVRSSDKSNYSVSFGASGDIPVPADHDGDHKTDLVFWTPASYGWNIKLSSTGSPATGTYGSASTDTPVSGDFDGDGLADKAYWKSTNHTFYFKSSSNGSEYSQSLGGTTDIPVCSDYDGDGKTDFAVLSGSTWIIHSSADGTDSSTAWQNSGDKPVPNDYDGDGKADIAVYHIDMGKSPYPGFWYIRQSSDLATRVESLGRLGDIPVPANFRH